MLSYLSRIGWKAGLIGMVFSLLGVTLALAASGDLDATFSGDGRQTTDFASKFSEQIFGLALQSDGKIVAVGHRYDPAKPDANASRNFALARYNTDGSLDSSFSSDGKQLTDFGRLELAMDVAIQPSDGKIVVAGQKCSPPTFVCDLAVARYNTDGSLDTTFSGDGKAAIGFGTGNNATFGGIVIQPDGKIVIAGFMTTAAGDFDFAVYRLNPNGSLDTTFSGDGRVSFGFGALRHDVAMSVKLQGSKLVVAGYTCASMYAPCDFAVARLTSAGALDTSFSTDGRQTTDFGADEHAYSLALQPDGKLVVIGETRTSTGAEFALARYNGNGSLDTTFSGDGKAVVAFGTDATGYDVLVQPNGRIVAGGWTTSSSKHDFGLARLNPSGSLDTTFSTDGKVTIPFSTHNAQADALVRQPDGKYVLGGSTYDGKQYDFALARVLP